MNKNTLIGLLVGVVLAVGFLAFAPNGEPEAQPQAYAQAAEHVLSLPQDQDKLYLSLFVPGDRDTTGYATQFDRDPELAQYKAQTHFAVYGTTDTIYKTRFAKYIPESATPAVLLTDAKGKVMYCGKHPNLPSYGYLADELRQSLPMGSVKTNMDTVIGGPLRWRQPVYYNNGGCRPQPAPPDVPAPPVGPPSEVPAVRPNTTSHLNTLVAIGIVVAGAFVGAYVGSEGKFNKRS